MAPSFPIEEPTMDAPSDWKTQFPSSYRPKIVDKIMETLVKHLPFCGPEGHNEARRIASRFEENVFSTASSETDYLQKISMKMLSMKAKSQNTGDWRTQLPPDSRQKNVEKIPEALKKHVPVSEEEGLDKLMGIADSFEELIFNTAENQVDYFRKVSFKIERE